VSTQAWDNHVDLECFLRARPRLFALARRIVGNVHEAEDVVQEVWVRWQRADRTAVRNADAFLGTVTVRLAINLIQCARRRHETPAAFWPDEERAGPGTDPTAAAERAEAAELAVDLLIKRLPPAERAAYLLREGYEYPYQRIAVTLRIGSANARQLVTRARARLAAYRETADGSNLGPGGSRHWSSAAANQSSRSWTARSLSCAPGRGEPC